MKNNPFIKETLKFSILSPIYRDDWKHLDRWLQSVKNQEYPHFEVVIVFDGENDDGVKEIEKLMHSKKYKEMDIKYYVMEPHGGKAAAVNFGFEKTTGDMISVLDSDSFLYPEALRLWANEFEDPKINRVWGYYDVLDWNGNPQPVGGGIPSYPNGKPDYWSVRFCPYIDSASPIRRSAWIPWDTTVKSLIDWEWSLRQLAKTNFVGDDFVYLPRPFFATSPVDEGGLSADSHQHWIERVKYVKKLNNIPQCDNVVSSLGAVHHGLHVAKKLGWDFMPMPSFKQHEYKKIYLLGFYPGNPGTTNHLQVFAKPNTKVRTLSDRIYKEDFCDAKKIIHWIGTDVLKMRTEIPFVTVKYLKELWEAIGVVHLTEFKTTHDELLELGIESKVVPIPPKKIYDFLPLPKKFCVGVYESTAQPLYNYRLMVEIARSMPDIDFKFFGDPELTGKVEKNITHYGYTDIEKIMPDMSCNLRITDHDGLPLLPIEFMTAGRNVVTNVDIPGAIKVGYERKDIVSAIRKAQDKPLGHNWHVYWTDIMDFDKYKKTLEEI